LQRFAFRGSILAKHVVASQKVEREWLSACSVIIRKLHILYSLFGVLLDLFGEFLDVLSTFTVFLN
jgi:hypothetical protein